ncbi:hypothetical protein KGM_209400 [Danaus plexippus plexippus]|uniref:Uncharacterized protein n=1 Tax=Danaus plexippus plexippus TaxID=278856 RepID=A0A212FLX6_DANPL|nr:hypothetical protein KGM_209400 [Danaus plexippus plexippus]
MTSAGRLEHLERSYLPPENHVHSENGFGSGNNHFGVIGSNSNGFSSNGKSSSGIHSNGHTSSFGSNRFGLASRSSSSNGLNRNTFQGATSNQYLPPHYGLSEVSNLGVPQFQYSKSMGSNEFRSNSGSQNSHMFNSQPQFGAASRQYLAPKYTSSQQSPQQSFDENSGYIY